MTSRAALGLHTMRSWLFVSLSLVVAATACGPQPPAVTAESGGTSASPADDRPTDLTASELRSYDGYLQRFPSPCGDGTIAICLDSARACRACPAAAKFVAKSVRSGFVSAEVEERYLARFDPTRVRAIDIKGSPVMGSADASVTIVEFADFQCPYCAATVPLIDDIVKSYAPHVRVVFKDFPIKYHTFAHSTAQAGVAAQNQGKFWELHHMMFGNRERLDRPDIEGYARSLNLDMKRFVKDWDAKETAARVNADYQQGESLNVRGTPAFFINGREFDFELFDFGGEDLLSWIELEIELTTGKPYKR